MSYWIGDLAEFSWDVEVDEVDTEPSAFVVTLTKPDGTTSPITPENPSPGHYTGQYSIDRAGHFVWVAVSTGDAQAVAYGVFDAFDPNPQTSPLTGIAAPWTDAAALARRPEIMAYNAAQTDPDLDPPGEPIPTFILDMAARFASEILYVLSGRQFAGLARTYCRPIARPEGWDVRSWGAFASANYWDSWGASYSMGYGAASAQALGYHLGQAYPAEVALSSPVRRVEEVKIDGVVIPADEYRVDDHRLLVRTRPTIKSVPTERSGWPHWQSLWLPDTERGTFAVTYWYGTTPPQSGVTAAEIFAVELALDAVGADNRLPARIREITRQGESAVVTDSLESLQKGWTGLPLCDYFISASNPYRLQRRASAWSPDTGRIRTPTT